jgi:choline dehydrogenase-like flavoprotein
VNLGAVHQESLRAADNISVYLNANLLAIEPDADGSGVGQLQVAAGTSRVGVRAQHYVLACGGIENPRILLANRLGNRHDLVGRYFMDHPYIFPGYVEPDRHQTLPDDFVIQGYEGNQCTQAMHLALGLDERHIRTDDLNGTSAYLVRRPRYKTTAPYWSPGGQGLMHLVEVLQRREQLDGRLGRDLRQMLTDFPNLSRAAWGRLQGLWTSDDVPALRVAIEPTPSPESRVRLGGATDRWGVPRPEVHWRLNQRDRIGYERLLQALRTELPRVGIGRLVEHGGREPDGWAGGMIGGKHHMGTTRMHEDPRQGVVDADCRVHGMTNLFLAGSSVFPTGGYANPTLTIAALAIRLADRLKAGLRKPG